MKAKSEEGSVVPRSTLYQSTSIGYGGESYRNHLLEQYKLYVQMADKISERRQSTNRFFLTVNTALIAFLGIVVGPSIGSDQSARTNPPLSWILVVSTAGVVLCFFWHQLVRSFRGLNKGKFAVIRAMEKDLPAAPYCAEREAVGSGKDPRLYRPFTRIETWIPVVFMALYAGLAVWNFLQAG